MGWWCCTPTTSQAHAHGSEHTNARAGDGRPPAWLSASSAISRRRLDFDCSSSGGGCVIAAGRSHGHSSFFVRLYKQLDKLARSAYQRLCPLHSESALGRSRLSESDSTAPAPAQRSQQPQQQQQQQQQVQVQGESASHAQSQMSQQREQEHEQQRTFTHVFPSTQGIILVTYVCLASLSAFSRSVTENVPHSTYSNAQTTTFGWPNLSTSVDAPAIRVPAPSTNDESERSAAAEAQGETSYMSLVERRRAQRQELREIQRRQLEIRHERQRLQQQRQQQQQPQSTSTSEQSTSWQQGTSSPTSASAALERPASSSPDAATQTSPALQPASLPPSSTATALPSTTPAPASPLTAAEASASATSATEQQNADNVEAVRLSVLTDTSLDGTAASTSTSTASTRTNDAEDARTTEILRSARDALLRAREHAQNLALVSAQLARLAPRRHPGRSDSSDEASEEGNDDDEDGDEEDEVRVARNAREQQVQNQIARLSATEAHLGTLIALYVVPQPAKLLQH